MSSSQPTVTLPVSTASQSVQKIVGKSGKSKELEEFRGIPFGTIPARWRHSSLRTRLPEDTFYAVKNGPKCPQLPEPNNSEGGFNASVPFPSDVTESEFDCLNLFVVRPSREALKQKGLDPDTPLPVFTWIHGGAYGFGAGTDPMWDPSNLVLEALALGKPFIAVNLNYRLGVLGFASSSAMIEAQSSDEIRGVNFGLRDQKVGLQWIANNISAFGGDPHRVTIAGQSAGGNSVHVHVLEARSSPSTPLFRKAVIQSGAVGCSGPVSINDAEAQWGNFCQLLGVSIDDKKKTLEAMLKFSSTELIQASRKMFWLLFPLVNDHLTLDFTPTLDPILVNLGLTSSVEEAKSDHEPIEVLVGGVDNEAWLYQRQICSVTSFEGVQAQFASCNVDSKIVSKALELYGITPEASLDHLKAALSRFLTEVQFAYPMFKAYQDFAGIKHNAGNVAHKTTARRFQVDCGNPFNDGPNNDMHGVAHHCVDIVYLFNVFSKEMKHADSLLKSSDGKYDVIRQDIQEDWINFIVDGHSQHVDQEPVVRYSDDRVRRVVKPKEDDFLSQQAVRYAFLSEHTTETRLLMNAFAGMRVC